MSDFWVTRGKGTGDFVHLWSGKPDRISSNGDVYFFAGSNVTGLKLSDGPRRDVLRAIYPDLLDLGPDSVRQICPPTIRVAD